MRHPTAEASTDDLLQFRVPESLRVLEAVSEGIGIPPMSSYALGFGDNSTFRDLLHVADLSVGASLQAVQVVKAGEVPIAPSRVPPAGAKLE